MTQLQVQTEINKIRKLLVNKYKAQKIILFGSYAWGKPDKDSDLDFWLLKRLVNPGQRGREMFINS